MWIGTEVTVYKLFGLISRYAQSLSETECRYTVNYTEIGGLGTATLLLGDIRQIHMIYLGCSRLMYVCIGHKCLYHVFVTAYVGYDT